MAGKSKPATLVRFAPLEVDYIVVRAENRAPARRPVYGARYWCTVCKDELRVVPDAARSASATLKGMVL